MKFSTYSSSPPLPRFFSHFYSVFLFSPFLASNFLPCYFLPLPTFTLYDYLHLLSNVPTSSFFFLSFPFHITSSASPFLFQYLSAPTLSMPLSCCRRLHFLYIFLPVFIFNSLHSVQAYTILFSSFVCPFLLSRDGGGGCMLHNLLSVLF